MDTNNKTDASMAGRVSNEEVLASSTADWSTGVGMFQALMESGGVPKVTNRRHIMQAAKSRKELGFTTDKTNTSQ